MYITAKNTYKGKKKDSYTIPSASDDACTNIKLTLRS